MFFHFTNQELSILIAIPITLIVQLWTLVIINKNKRHWRAYDIPIVALLCAALLRNVSIFIYVVSLQQFPASWEKLFINTQRYFDKCSLFVWTFNSSHTFHASCLLTLSVIGAFRVRMNGNERHLRQYLTSTHVIYHLFCLMVLCACVGVAAILAEPESYAFAANFDHSKRAICDLLPYQLDVKFNAFIVVLHSFLATVAMACCIYASVVNCVRKRRRRKRANTKRFDDTATTGKKSPSQQSLTTTVNTLTLQRSGAEHGDAHLHQYQHGYYDTYTIRNNNNNGDGTLLWKVGGGSDFASNVSTTVSSTNSRRPLNGGHLNNSDEDDLGSLEGQQQQVSGLETINTVLLVSYLVYHFPVIALCIFPNIVHPHLAVGSVILWLGLLQDLLTPIALGLIDSRFNVWVSNVYKCDRQEMSLEGKLPHAGLDGKFRHFGSQPPSLDYQMHPILIQHTSNNSTAMGPHRALINVGASVTNSYHNGSKFPITNGSLYTSIDGRVPVIHNYRRHKHNQNGAAVNMGLHSANLLRNHNTTLSLIRHHHHQKRNNDLPMCPSKAEAMRKFPGAGNFNILRHVSLSQESLKQMPLGNADEQIRIVDSYHGDDVDGGNMVHFEFDTRANCNNNGNNNRISNRNTNYFSDTSSLSSSYSITTEANGDFEFFHQCVKANDEVKAVAANNNRSLDDLRGRCRGNYDLVKMGEPSKSTSAEFLNDSVSNNGGNKPQFINKFSKIGGSVPDFKRIFISEYL